MTVLMRITFRLNRWSFAPISFHYVKGAWFGFHILYVTKEHKGGRTLLSFTKREKGQLDLLTRKKLEKSVYEIGFLFMNITINKPEVG